RADRRPGVEAGRGAARTAAQGDAGGRAEDYGRRPARAVGGGLRQEPDQFWRHRAKERAVAGQSLAETVGKRAKIGLREKISLQLLRFRLGFAWVSVADRHSPDQGNLCMVRRALGISS